MKENESSQKKEQNSKVKIRGDRKTAENLTETSKKLPRTPNPIKRQIKINQFPWTERQKEFFRVALF